MPSMKYVFAPEIFGHAQRIAKQYGLYDNALFSTAVTGLRWDDDRSRWVVTTDRGDASGTGYWSPSSGGYRTDLLERAFGRILELPAVAGPEDQVGELGGRWGAAPGAVLGPGTGDNMAAVYKSKCVLVWASNPAVTRSASSRRCRPSVRKISAASISTS